MRNNVTNGCGFFTEGIVPAGAPGRNVPNGCGYSAVGIVAAGPPGCLPPLMAQYFLSSS